MKLIVGLGNPGKIYIDSRHNIGFSVIKALAKNYKIPFKKEPNSLSFNGKGRLNGQNAILAMPFTFMNLSGMAVAALLKKYRVDLENLLVVLDDLDLRLGRMKLRPLGSSAGHRGLQSIINSVGSQGFARLRIGIGRPKQDIDLAEYVLSPFMRKEKEQARQIIEDATQCCAMWVIKGITETANIFNQRSRRHE